VKLYLHIFEDCSDCETCGYNYGTIYTLSEYPFDSDEGHNCFSSGTGASCYGGQDGTLQHVINYINSAYIKDIKIDHIGKDDLPKDMTFYEYQEHYDRAIIKCFARHGIDLHITRDEATIDNDDDYDDYNDYNDPDDEGIM